jgi:hypothetical protein
MLTRATSILASCIFVYIFVVEGTCQTRVEASPPRGRFVGFYLSTSLFSGFAVATYGDTPVVCQTLIPRREVLDSPNSSQSSIGPDIVVKDLGVTEDRELYVLLANAGPVDLREGLKLRVRISVNNRRVSEFDHYVGERLRADLGSHVMIHPPYRITITGTSRVRVSVKPLSPSSDVRPENNSVERNFLIYPFRIGRQAKQEFSFSVPARRVKGNGLEEKVKTEARWDGGLAALRLSVTRPGRSNASAVSGKSPLKMELPVVDEEIRRGSNWRVSLTNLITKKVEGHLVIQHP